MKNDWNDVSDDRCIKLTLCVDYFCQLRSNIYNMI